jgi:phage baseplate assembly protein W
MAIKIKNLQQVADDTNTLQKYVYKDLSLDLILTQIQSPGYPLPLPGFDIKASFDINAITNSLTNLFNTLPGKRFLFPAYGLDLYKFLFEPITKINGQALGNKIYQSIRLHEPRVNPLQVSVLADKNNNLYDIKIFIEIPILSQTTTTQFALDLKKQSFIFISTTRNN